MQTPESNSPLAIVGIGCLFPKAAGPGFFWANVKHGVDCIGDVPPTHWNPEDYFDADPKTPDMTYARRGGFLDVVDFNPLEFGISPRDIEATDTTQLLGLVAAKQALVDAGVVLANPDHKVGGAVSSPSPLAGEGSSRSERVRGKTSTSGTAFPSPASRSADLSAGRHSGREAPPPSPARGEGEDHPLPDGRGSPKQVDRERVSVILGVTGTLELVIPLGARLGHPKWKRAMRDAGVAESQIEDAAGRIAESYVSWQENSFPGLLGNVVAGRIANRLDLQGTNCVVDAACASSLSAVHLAAMELQTGRADVVVTGGCDTFNDIFMYMCFSKTPALSATGNARPFDADGDGTILGEGLGVVVLKRLADAVQAGDTIYAVIRGIGSSSDGKGNAIYAPSAEGQRRCLLNAYANAGVSPDTIELVEAHGTGTKVGDATEATALTEVYANRANPDHEGGGATSHHVAHAPGSPKPRPWAALGSVKSQIGHTKAAAGAASLIKVALALYNKVLPPTIKVTKPVEPLANADSPFYVNTQMRPWLPRAEHPRRAALSAFGFGGSNFHAVLQEYNPEKREPDWDGSVDVVALGADTPQALAAAVGRLEAAIYPSPTPPRNGEGLNPPPSLAGKGVGGLGASDWPAFARFAEESRASFDPSAPCRLCFAAHRALTDLPKLLASAKSKLIAEPEAIAWHTPDGAHFGRGAAPGTLAVLFPGQGSQAVGMLRELVCLFPEMLDSLAAADRAVAEQMKDETDTRRLSDRIYPPTSFDPEAKDRREADLRATKNAQPALGAVSFGAWRVLSERFGLKADTFAGHSYGELVALAAAGRFTPDELFALSRLRGRLMGEQRTDDRGTMLAVIAPLPDIERVMAEYKLDLVVANKNAPKQTVLSGATAEIERAAKVVADAGLKTARLPVAAAFHSPLVADAAVPFRAALEVVEFKPSEVPVFANTTAAKYPEAADEARDLLANQLAKPVAFVELIRAMAGSGSRTFLEVGPGSVLTRLSESILADNGMTGVQLFALDASGGKRSGVLELGNVLARLAARGHYVQLTAWEQNSRCRPAPTTTGKRGMTVPLSGANYVNPRPARPRTVGRSVPDMNHQSVRHSPTTNASAVAPSAQVAGMPNPDPNALAQALLMTQQSLAALQRMQEQTAALHKQFLDSQEAAQRTLQTLVEQQQTLLLSGLGTGVALPAVSLPTPAPSLAPLPVGVPEPATVRLPVAQNPTPQPPPRGGEGENAKAPPSLTHLRKGDGGLGFSSIATTLLSVVSEKTGYPVESLDLSLSLDADLGVDSIKRVEILAALQERLPNAPQVKPEHLGSLHCLQDVADFLAGPSTAAPQPVESDEELPHTKPLSKDPEARRKATTDSFDIAQVLLSVVSEKTGYPVESLDLSLSLDADLGVDSIKRVEILAALQERLPNAPQVKPEHLGSLHCLQDVADFLAGRTVVTAPATTKIPITPPPVPVETIVPRKGEGLPPGTDQMPALRTGIGSVAEAKSDRGRKSDALRQTIERSSADPSLRGGAIGTDRVDRSILQAVDLDLGTIRSRVPLSSGGEFWVVAERDPLTEAIVELLTGHGFKPKLLAWSAAVPAKPALPLTGLVLIAPKTSPAESGLNRRAFEWLKHAIPFLRQTGRAVGATFVTIARLDGAFGLADLGLDADPMAGGLAGLTKTARHEWPEVYCKALDLAPGFTATHAAAAAVVDEILTAGPAEVGISTTHRCTLELARTIRRPSSQLINLGTKDVILVTGGARGVTAEVAIALAETYSLTLILTGRTPPPTPEPDWLAALSTEAELKKAIAAKLGPDAGPKQVGEQYQKVIAQRDVRRTLDRIAQTGARVAYFPVNITDAKAVAELLQQVRTKYGPVTALVHGAGVLADKRIEDLTCEQFDHVYATKVDGLRLLLKSLGQDELKALVLFSSTTARFGRVGQVAYACANEVLNKVAQVESRRRPRCRVVSVNWGPWDGGMVTPGLRKVFETEGVGLIPLLDGAVFLMQELSAAGKAVEVIALGKHRSAGSGAIPHPAGLTITPPPIGGSLPSAQLAGMGPSTPEMSLAFERVVDTATHPVLKAHVLDGRAVLPMALHLEWLAHAALHGNPGLVFHGFNDLRVTNGMQVDGSGSVHVRAFAGKAVKHDKLFLVPVELRGRRKDGREVPHSRAEIVLVSALPPIPPADNPPAVRPLPYPVPQAYRELLFHGRELHGIDRIEGMSESAFLGTAYPAPSPTEWFQVPLRSAWVADPLVLDVSFQMMILWTLAQHDTGSLPCYAGRYRQYRRSFPTERTTIVIRVRRDDGKFARADIDYLDPDGRIVAQMQDYECVMEKSLTQAFRKNQLVRQ